jgi:hypothetical protein
MIILSDFLNGKTLTATDKHYSNTNQYFDKIKKRGIELQEIKVKNDHNSQSHLKRSLAISEENIKKAEDYLLYLTECNSERNKNKQ